MCYYIIILSISIVTLNTMQLIFKMYTLYCIHYYYYFCLYTITHFFVCFEQITLSYIDIYIYVQVLQRNTKYCAYIHIKLSHVLIFNGKGRFRFCLFKRIFAPLNIDILSIVTSCMTCICILIHLHCLFNHIESIYYS